MRWFNFGILVFAVLVVQAGVCRLFGLGQLRIVPDLFLLVGLIVAFRGPSHQAPTACWLLGLFKDLSSEAVLGSYALVFALLAVGIVRLREFFYGDHPLTLIVLTLAGSFLVEHLVLAIAALRGDFTWTHYGQLAGVLLLSGLFTAGLAPYGQWLMLKLHRPLGLPRQRRYRW